MQLCLINGSPRGLQSNTRLLLEDIAHGFGNDAQHQVSLSYMAKRKSWPQIFALLPNADIVVLAMPLYVHAMPALVKEFIEQMPLFSGPKRVRLGFLIQSGFPEAAQSYYLRRYLQRLPERLNADYLGTVIKGGVEGIQAMPAWMTRAMRKDFVQLGRALAQHGSFDAALLAKLANPARLSTSGRLIFRIVNGIGLGPDHYFDSLLKKNGALERSQDQPYARQNAASNSAQVR